MIIACFRCSKPIEDANAINADYIMAEDTKADELREVFVALKDNEVTLSKKAMMAETETFLADDGETELTRRKYPDTVIDDNDYDVVEVTNVEEARLDPATVRIEVRSLIKSVQKTGLICPECCLPTDTVIWGKHKKES